MNKLVKISLAILASFSLITLCATPSYAADDACNSNVPAEIRQAAGCDGSSTSTTIQDIITNILYGIISILGIVAVVFIIKGGIEYMTSSGDSAKIQKARNTIIYAAIGLVVCVLSFAIVNFTIGIIKGNSSSGNNSNNTNNSTTNNNTDNNTNNNRRPT